MSALSVEADSEALEALFDSIVRDNAAKSDAPTATVEAEVEQVSTGAVMSRIGQLTRVLHDALRELGYDHLLEKTAAAMPDTRDRLDYVVKMTEQAAVRALNAIERAQPIQDRMGSESQRLAATWQKLFDKQLSVEEFKLLVAGTREFLADIPMQTRATNAELMEIMMAQDFQDLTGQVIKKITDLARSMEQELVHLLVDLVPAELRKEVDSGLLNGPPVNAATSKNAVTDQNQVDELLATLGF
jgi:chemotaxis protein CheZ